MVNHFIFPTNNGGRRGIRIIKHYTLTTFCCALLIGLSGGCKESEKENKAEEEEVAMEQYAPSVNEVDIEVLQEKPFLKEILANGKLEANQQSVLKFRVGGTLEKLYIKNGDRVAKGSVLAEIDPFEYRQALSNTEIDHTKAKLELEDMLVGRGYDLAQRDSIPDNIYEMATIRSGYAQAENQLKKAQVDYDATRLRAPFSGTIANLKFKTFDQIGAGSPVLTLIDDHLFEVTFTLIETEVDEVSVGERVEVLAFEDDKSYVGKITSINPVVERNGMVKVKAHIANDGKLMEGMNVKLRIQKEVPKKLVVPKSAVILRQNQEVLFKYINGKAFWTYVNTTHENSTSYAVIPDPDKTSASLEPGDSIIISGNLNLAHESKVEIKTIH